jgi:tetratricopeptide (TPR) repeat protein
LGSILLAACSRKPAQTGPERIAILRFENMGADVSTDWVGRALSEVVTQEVGGIPSVALHSMDRLMGGHPVSAPGISAEISQALASGASRVGYGEFTVRNGKLETRLTLEDARTLKMVKVVEAVTPAGDVLGAAAALARQISTSPKPYGTSNPEALMHYSKAIESTDSSMTERELEQAIAADPDFAAAYIPLAQAKVQKMDRAGAQAVLEKGLTRTNIPEANRARFEVDLADLRGDVPARMTALAKLGKLESSDGTAWRALAELAMARHEYTQARQAYEKAVALAPQDADLLNSLGYAAAQSGELDAGVSALKRYRALRPKEANPLDSLGDIHLLSGKLDDAENDYLDAQKADRAFLADGDLIKAAMARLLTGDVAAADKIAEQYFDARAKAKDPLVDYRRSQWNWVAGRRRQAIAQMGAFAQSSQAVPALRDAAAHAWSDLAVWLMMLGDRNAASQAVQKAVALATPASAGSVVVARFLTLPEASPVEWGTRANQQFGAQLAIKNVALAYALLMNRQFLAAQALLEPMWQNGASQTDEGLPVLLAWCYLETGKAKEAEALLRPNPIPQNNGPGPYTGFYLPRLFYLRGMLAEQQGRKDEAHAEYHKFLALSGPDPLMWGEEKRAQAALGR